VNDAEVVLGYVRKVRAACALSHCPYIRSRCFQAIIHLDVAALGHLDSRLVKADSLCVWRTPKRNKNVGSFYRSPAVFALNLQMNALSRNAFDVPNLRAQQNVNSFVLEQLQNGLCDISVFAWRKLRAASDQSYAAPESAYGLGQLEPDEPASQDDQVFGKTLQVERLDMRHWPRIRQPGYARYSCVGSNVHKYALTSKYPFAAVAQSNLEGTRSDESTITEN
jgi:hypothetical protein